jgi:hypothetical protein
MDLRLTSGRARKFLFYMLALLSLSRSAAAGGFEPMQKLFVASSEESRPSASTDSGTEDERPGGTDVAASPSQPTDSLPVYTPPRRATPRGVVAGGTRNTRGLPAPLALVPEHVAQTLSATPSLFWWVSATPPEGAHATLTITTDDAIEPLAEVALPLPLREGVQRVRLGDFGIALEPGVEYEWSIALSRSAQIAASDPIANGYITRVPEPGELKARGKSVASLASLGLWYDALSAVSDEIEARPGDPRPVAARNALLRQAGLNAAAE